MLKKIVEANKKDWDRKLDSVLRVFLDLIQSGNKTNPLEDDIHVGSHCANEVFGNKLETSNTRKVANCRIQGAKNPRTAQARTGKAKKYLAN